MKNAAHENTELSPLDQVRQVEAEVTRSIAAARDRAEASITEAKNQVKSILEEARQEGRKKGQIRYKEIVLTAEEESKALISQANNEAENLRLKGKQMISNAVYQAVNFVMGMEGENKQDEY